jgi:protease PrsW
LQLNAPDAIRRRRLIGAIVYALAFFTGAVLLLAVFLVPPLFADDTLKQYGAMLLGAALALPAALVYVWIPWVVDRYDPEPPLVLLGAFGWGAIVACGFSAVINSAIGQVGAEIGGPQVGEFMSASLSAPIFEELFKGLGLIGLYLFLRQEFDGIVDGVIYAAFIALGFAGVENVIYYGRAATQELGGNSQTEGLLGNTFLLRGILTPWLHPLFTSMTGLGLGLARETTTPWVRFVAPVAGYAFAVFLHSVWNTAASVSGMLTLVMLPLWFLLLVGFAVMMAVLVARKGRIIQEHLQDEVLLGRLTVDEYQFVTSAFAYWKATFTWGGAPARRFLSAATRLALSKWHSMRAAQGQHRTLSGAFVAPLRQELKTHRLSMSQALGRQLPDPKPWEPTAEQPRPPFMRLR